MANLPYAKLRSVTHHEVNFTSMGTGVSQAACGKMFTADTRFEAEDELLKDIKSCRKCRNKYFGTPPRVKEVREYQRKRRTHW